MTTDLLKKNLWTLVTAVALVATLLIYTICFTVQAGTVGVVKTFGAISRIKEDAGFALKAPWPFQSVVVVDTRLRLLDSPGVEELTRDEFNLIAEVSVGWRVSDAKLFLTRLGNSERKAEDLIASRVTDARKRMINQTNLSSLISTEPGQRGNFIGFEEGIENLVSESLPQEEDSRQNYGVAIEFVRVKRLGFPTNVSQSILDLMTKERNRLSDESRAQGDNLAKTIKDEAEAKRKEMLAEADSKAIILRGQGDAEAVRYYRIFNENPELANYVRELDAFKNTIGKDSTIILPSNVGPWEIIGESAPKMTPSKNQLESR